MISRACGNPHHYWTASELYVSQSGVEKHINTIFTQFDIAPDTTYNRRVLAVLAYLRDR